MAPSGRNSAWESVGKSARESNKNGKATNLATPVEIRDFAADPTHYDNNENYYKTLIEQSTSDQMISAACIFSKGLPHDAFGRVFYQDLQRFLTELSSPTPTGFSDLLYRDGYARPSGGITSRKLESPFAAIHAPQKSALTALTLRTPPQLGSPELTLELAEIYCAALLRDVAFVNWATDPKVGTACAILTTLPAAQGIADQGQLFRGTTRGAQIGPYVSQFLLVGNTEKPSLGRRDSEVGPIAAQSAASQDSLNRAASFVPPPSERDAPLRADASESFAHSDGFIRYGPQAISQRIYGHLRGLDHMTEWATWRDVQNGSNRKDSFDRFEPISRFLASPRDLASYVHFAGRAQPFANAALILMGAEEPTDSGLPEGLHHPTRDGSATFGLSHLLALLGQAELIALRAVFEQKFQHHRRARPERTAASVALAWAGGAAQNSLGNEQAPVVDMMRPLADSGLLAQIGNHNRAMNAIWEVQYGDIDLGPLHTDRNALLPMAWPEGAPMHPGYGSAQGAVAGACATVLKAFFEVFAPAAPPGPDLQTLDAKAAFPANLFRSERTLTGSGAMLSAAQIADPNTGFTTLTAAPDSPVLTLQGELDKLADNIAFAGLFAGVNFRSDAHSALRLGERIAMEVLMEHLQSFNEPISLRFQTFDGAFALLRNQGPALMWTGTGHRPIPFDDWWAAAV